MIRPPLALASSSKFRARQQRAAAQHDDRFAGVEHRPADILDDGRRRAFDRDVGMRRKLIQRHDRAGDAFRVQERLGLGAVAGSGAGQRQAGHAGAQFEGQHAADGSKPCDSDANIRHFGGVLLCQGGVYVCAKMPTRSGLTPGGTVGKAAAKFREDFMFKKLFLAGISAAVLSAGLVSGGTASAQDFPTVR